MKKILIWALCLSSLASCEKKDTLVLPPVKEDTVKPGPGTPGTSIDSLLDSAPVLIWIEAAANFNRLSTIEKMNNIFGKIADMGVKGIVLDVKGIPGLVSYHSNIAERFKTWNGVTHANDFDYLKNAITAARANGLKIFVSMSVFGEGINYYGTRLGKVFNDPDFAAIQSQVMTVSGTVKKITDEYAYGMINALQPKAQDYELSLIKEVVTNYEVDGFVLDYCRYFDICADFSDYSLDQFKTWAGLATVSPTDIVTSWKLSNGATVPDVTGPQFNKWLEFRAKSIYDFVVKARQAVKNIKPKLVFGSYTGAWYDSYYNVGVNWASNTYDPSKDGFWWATSTYKNTGYAEQIDLFMTGNYTANITGPGWWTVQGQLSGTKRILNGANRQYGSVDIGNTGWSNLQNMKDAISTIKNNAKGVMLFDLVHIDDAVFNQFGKQLYNDVKSALGN